MGVALVIYFINRGLALIYKIYARGICYIEIAQLLKSQ